MPSRLDQIRQRLYALDESYDYADGAWRLPTPTDVRLLLDTVDAAQKFLYANAHGSYLEDEQAEDRLRAALAPLLEDG